ncbi:transcription factor Vhr1-domain-containing protein [Lipomyces kononenkoae]|uniref:Transcription factor Vhr1-domain-containing protein n=1 Tax=Lipomyces kononenkoae TaxID=34357 RepID=A0ACC3T5U0_LIPKO
MADTSVMPSLSALHLPSSLRSSSSTATAYCSPSPQPSLNNPVNASMPSATLSDKSLSHIRTNSSYGVYTTTGQLPSPRTGPKTLRIECSGRVIQWHLDDEHLNFSRLQNYIQSAFFIEDERQFSMRYKVATYSDNTGYQYIHNDASLQEALGNVDICVEVQIHKLEEGKGGLSFTALRRPNKTESGLTVSVNAAANSSRYVHLRSPTHVQGPYGTVATSPVSPSAHTATFPQARGFFWPIHPTPSPSLASLSSSAEVLQRRKSSIFIPPPLKRSSSTRISGVTQTIRQKLQFTDEGQWKKFSARRLELIDSMSLSTKKASEQDDVIIAVADTLREEYGFPPQTLPDFDKLVRAAVQSVRRNRKRLPKSKARSKSLSVERDSPKEEHQKLSQSAQLKGQWPSSSNQVNRVGSSETLTDVSSDAARPGSAPCSISYVSYRPALLSRRSEPAMISSTAQSFSHASLLRSPTESLSSSTSTLSSCLSGEDDQDFYSTCTGTVVHSRDNLPRSLPGPATLTSLSQSPMIMELIYDGRVIPCAIHLSELAGTEQSVLSFFLNTVRKTLSLHHDAPVALYYLRSSDGVRVQITSDVDANLALRTAVPSAGATKMQNLRVEVITMTQVQALHQLQQSATHHSPSPQLPPSSSADAASRISIGALVGV